MLCRKSVAFCLSSRKSMLLLTVENTPLKEFSKSPNISESYEQIHSGSVFCDWQFSTTIQVYICIMYTGARRRCRKTSCNLWGIWDHWVCTNNLSCTTKLNIYTYTTYYVLLINLQHDKLSQIEHIAACIIIVTSSRTLQIVHNISQLLYVYFEPLWYN